MKLTATADRQSALQNNIGDATSLLQTQDGALSVTGSILDRISELETLYQDPTKNSSDKANYDDEFNQLQTELNSIENQTFNGVSLFGAGSLTVATTDDLSSSGDVDLSQADVFGDTLDSGFGDFTTNGLASISGGTLSLFTNGAATTNRYFSGAFQVNFDISGQGSGPLGLSLPDTAGGGVDFGTSFANGTSHSIQVNRDNAGNITFTIDGEPATDDNEQSLSGNTGDTRFLFYVQGAISSVQVTNFSVTNPDAPSNLSTITSASSLGSLSISTITSAIQDAASARAQNGAEQSRLGFASELLTTNQTNLQSAISSIDDVDVAQETTALAKWNVLVQAGTSMLTQANQSAQIALKLITG